LLTFNYVSCRALCDQQLRGLAAGLEQLTWTPGQDYQLVSVSLDPQEDAGALRAKADRLAQLVRHDKARWRMLRGDSAAIAELASSVGFRYAYDSTTKQYAHPPLLIVLTPDGRVARYLQGTSYAARDLKLALLEASAGKLGSRAEAALLSCFEFDALTGRYSLAVLQLVRAGGILMLALIGAGFLWLRARARLQRGPA
jgi:protein SCO1